MVPKLYWLACFHHLNLLSWITKYHLFRAVFVFHSVITYTFYVFPSFIAMAMPVLLSGKQHVQPPCPGHPPGATLFMIDQRFYRWRRWEEAEGPKMRLTIGRRVKSQHRFCVMEWYPHPSSKMVTESTHLVGTKQGCSCLSSNCTYRPFYPHNETKIYAYQHTRTTNELSPYWFGRHGPGLPRLVPIARLQTT